MFIKKQQRMPINKNIGGIFLTSVLQKNKQF